MRCQIRKTSGLWGFLSCLLIIFLFLMGCKDNYSRKFKELEKQVLPTFQIPEGFKIGIIAAEPLVSDPVDMAIDERGNMYVVEMHGYPLDEMGVDDVVMLRDTDGDGVMDTKTIFVDSLVHPNGVMAWKNGIIVTVAPHVIYFEDTDGDGKADVRDTLLTGFALSNPQHNVNNPRFALDNWIYLAHQGIVKTEKYEKEFGDTGKDVYFPAHPDSPRLGTNANSVNVRFKPDQFLLQNLSTNSQFGQTWNAWGEHFLLNNTYHIYQEVIASRYISRNPNFRVSKSYEFLSDHGQPAEIYPITKDPIHQLLTQVGVFTSACALTSYQGGAFPAEYNNNDVTFVCEPANNIVHADKLRQQGARFAAGRVLQNKEFFASTDSWFRPVNLYVGPDGALYVLDYYREIIEHPEWLSEEVIKSGKLYNGSTKGRIYRISAMNAPPAKWTKGLNLKKSTDEELVNYLANDNSWWRNTAQRLIVTDKREGALLFLQKLAQNSDKPLGRLHALWTLEGLGKLSPDLIVPALSDASAGVRQNAIRLAELHMSNRPDLVEQLVRLKDDPDVHVRYQLLLTLGFINTPQVNKIREELLMRDVGDKWMQIAALSSQYLDTKGLLATAITQFPKNDSAYGPLIQRLGSIIGYGKDDQLINTYIRSAKQKHAPETTKWQAFLMNGIAEGLKATKKDSASAVDRTSLMEMVVAASDISISKSALNILRSLGTTSSGQPTRGTIAIAHKIALSASAPEEKRAIAIEFLALVDTKEFMSLFKQLINAREPLAVQTSALNALFSQQTEGQSKYILDRWNELSPDLRSIAIDRVSSDSVGVDLLLADIEQGKINKNSVSYLQGVKLMTLKNDRLREKARALLATDDNNRGQVIKDYEAAINLKGDPMKGKEVYKRACSICHQVKGELGRKIGPDLGTVQAWDFKTLVTNILDPSRTIANGYDFWDVKLKDGKSSQGIISSESSNAITLLSMDGQEKVVSRDDIQSLQSLGISVMPTGLESQIDKQQMADLIAFIKEH